MKRHVSKLAAGLVLGGLVIGAGPVGSQIAEFPLFPRTVIIGDERAVTEHLDQALIDRNRIGLRRLVEHGRVLFEAAFTEADGQSRPSQNGVFPPVGRTPRIGPENFNRISAPDADSCSGCHNKPRTGGGGDNVANVFVLGQRFSFFSDPTQADENGLPAPGTLQGAADERNTLGMFGSGLIEMLAREMTVEMHGIRDRAVQQAAATNQDVRLPLVAKGVGFGFITARPDGSLFTGEVEGVNGDMIIRPFHQKGVVVSLREFTNNAFFHHHGMQPVERFGAGTDSDGDGVTNELSVGDITAATIFQAQLATPGQVIPRDPRFRLAIRRGEQLFRSTGCASCHIPELRLNDPVFTEPNPFNPPMNLRVSDVPRVFRMDMRREGELPRPDRDRGGLAVQAFTDLKRHNLGSHPLINNESVVQGGVPTNVFITRKLWGMASEPHFIHNGRATRISEAILCHGGEAQESRDAFTELTEQDQRAMIEFLKSLRILPPRTPALVVDEFGRPVRD